MDYNLGDMLSFIWGKRTSRDDEDYIKDAIILNVARTGSIKAAEIGEKFGYDRTTIYPFVNELLDEHIIKKYQRDWYGLYLHRFEITLDRNTLISEDRIYDKYISEHLGYSGKTSDIWRYSLSELIEKIIEYTQIENLEIRIAWNYFGVIMTLVLDIDNFDILLQEYASNSMMVLSQLMDDFRIQSGRRERYYSTLYEENHLPEFRPAEIDNRTYVRMALRDFVYKDTLSLTTCKSLPEILTKCLFPDVDCKDTTIILKKHFDSPPVSRLQAKNLCAFFDGFSAVTLDFDEVDWVSPSFMHQIFVVYQREHPDVYIKPIHMNGPVVNVYRYIIRAAICQS